MAITGGFGLKYDVASGCPRSWYMGRDGVKRWAHNDKPCDDELPDGLPPIEPPTGPGEPVP